MSILAGLTTDKTIVGERDSVGGFKTHDSDIYLGLIKLAYITTSAGKAMAMNLVFNLDNGETFKTQFWMTSGEAKGCKNYYISKPGTPDEKKHYLPGFNQANGVALLTLDKEVSTLATEKKTINLYDSSVSKEVPTEVDCVVELIGKSVYIGILKQLTNKNVKNADTGKYEPTAETREQNEVDKIFCAHEQFKKCTMMEILSGGGGAVEPIFAETWLKHWKGKVQDKTTKTGVVAGAPTAARENGASAPSLFGKPSV